MKETGDTESSGIGLGEMLERGGIYYSLKGSSIHEILGTLIKKIPGSKTMDAEKLLKAVMEREALMSTGIGNGIAIPHPRNPAAESSDKQFAALAFLDHPMDWKAPDGNPVDTLFLIVSASARYHLKMLSVIAFLCQNEEFTGLMKERVSQETLIRFIKESEQKWIRGE